MIRKSEITFEPDDIDGRFEHKPITEKRVGCFQEEKLTFAAFLIYNVSK